MAVEFGPFELDEAGRVVLCARQEVPLQPRVFDLLVYLFQNRDRVVSKDELLEAVWPNVTVTDNSLQRAVSALRAMLRLGGMESAIRNVPGKGYRLCVDPEPVQPSAGHAAAPSPADNLDRATRAFSGHAWAEAARLYEAADGHVPLDGSALDRWAMALQCTGRPAEAIPVLVRAVAAHAKSERFNDAASDAVTLASLHLERGQEAVASGWLARAEQWTLEHSDPTATALVLWMRSKVAAFEGRPEQALTLAEQAYATARQAGELKSEALSLAYRGFYRLSLGDTRGGFADQDHAAALALSENVDPITGATLYCNILWACRTFGDWTRAEQWTRGYQSFCAESRMELSGACQLHRSEVLGVRGSLAEALARVDDSLQRLVHDAPWAVGDAHRVLGDIQAAIGNVDAAHQAYDRAYTLGWCPEPGRAMLLLEEGEAEAAYASLERSLIGSGWWTLQRKGVLLAHQALVAAHTGRHHHASKAIAELTGGAERWPMPSIHALTNEARAVLAQARQDDEGALRHLHLARQLWSSIEGRVHATRLRIRIAKLQLQRGDCHGASAEIQAARLGADALGSDKLKRDCAALQRDLDARIAAHGLARAI